MAALVASGNSCCKMLAKLSSAFISRSFRSMAPQTVKVQVRQGVVVGRQERLPNGTPYHCFQGVPYAVPPLGALRFKSPVYLERFDVPELDCTRERNISHQRDPISQQEIGSENCLFLNVYVPVLQQSRSLPVMVWIHGGGFWFGSANSDATLPLSLLEEGVAVVTVTYRLGALGFLCLPEEGIWGNAGLKDQRLALQWVQDNISNFNGDPDNVTLFGESAGAAAVHLHTYAKHAHKLFHKAIMQSGTANLEWVYQANTDYKTRRLCKLLGCKSENTREMLAFLQSPQVTPQAILANTTPVLTPDERRRGLPFVFKPVIEHASSPDSILDTPFLERLCQHDTLAMPIMMGYNSAEGIVMVVNAQRKLQELDADLARFVPRDLPFPPEHATVQKVAQQMRQFYFGRKPLNPKILNTLADMLSDYHFVVGIQRAAELQVQHQPRAPLYFYRFDYVGGRNMYKRICQLEHLRGACHGDEMCYLFQTANDDSPLTEEDALIIRRLARLWANFARYGNPTPNGCEDMPVIDCEWTAVRQLQNTSDSFILDFLVIDKHCEMRTNPDKERIQFWRDIYSNYTPIDYSRLSAKL